VIGYIRSVVLPSNPAALAWFDILFSHASGTRPSPSALTRRRVHKE
jgi:hypothetical protein